LALEAGLSPAIADAIAANQRPAGMAKDEESVYDFVSQLLATGSVSDAAFQRVKDAFGERGVVDLVGAVGYYSLVSMTLNVAQVPLPTGVTPPLKLGEEDIGDEPAWHGGASRWRSSIPKSTPMRRTPRNGPGTVSRIGPITSPVTKWWRPWTRSASTARSSSPPFPCTATTRAMQWRCNGLIPAASPSSSRSIRMIRRSPMSSPTGRGHRARSASGS